MIKSATQKRMLLIPQVLAFVAVALVGFIDLNQTSDRVKALLLLGVFGIFLFVPFFWHRQVIWVHISLAVLSALAAVLMTLETGWNFFPILFFLLAPAAMIHLPVKTGLLWIGLFTVITAVAFFVANGPIGLPLVLPFASGYIFFGIFGWMMIESERNRARSEQLLAELQTTHQQLQDYAARLEELTITQERNRIAREMHDSLGHRLTIAAVQLEGAQRLIPAQPERAAAMVGTVREQVKEGLADLRRTVAMLRATVDEDLPLDQALTRLVEQVQQATSLKIHLSLQDCPQRLPLPQHQALYRAAQEGLTNIQRHARASEAWLQLTGRAEEIELLVSDNGVGISTGPAPSGFGLVGLKERAALLGGDFQIDARPGGGTQMTFRVPMPKELEPVSPDRSCQGNE